MIAKLLASTTLAAGLLYPMVASADTTPISPANTHNVTPANAPAGACATVYIADLTVGDDPVWDVQYSSELKWYFQLPIGDNGTDTYTLCQEAYGLDELFTPNGQPIDPGESSGNWYWYTNFAGSDPYFYGVPVLDGQGCLLKYYTPWNDWDAFPGYARSGDQHVEAIYHGSTNADIFDVFHTSGGLISWWPTACQT